MNKGQKVVPVQEAVGLILAHDITEVRPGEFKGRAFKKGHIVTEQDIEHLLRLGKEHLYLLEIADDELHENDAALLMANALTNNQAGGVSFEPEPKEGKITLIAGRDGLFKVNKDALMAFNMLGEVMCATLHTNTVVAKGQTVGGVRTIPLLVKKALIDMALNAVINQDGHHQPALSVLAVRAPKAGVVITGSEVYTGKIQDSFLPVVRKKINRFNGVIIGQYFAPDDETFIAERLMELAHQGADLLITTGGLSVDPDDVTSSAIARLPVTDVFYGTAVLPGAMFLIAYMKRPGSDDTIPILCMPACGMYHKITVFDLLLPRVLAGEHIDRRALAEMGHGGLCMNCKECRYPVCPFGK
ncbi:MAG: molybdopterin-binding protein [Candidatus Magnetominusculus sp. LBB02]|nr:molybdopterin-binding protein [Candidatus Magnetominusculus sp. LBB02]